MANSFLSPTAITRRALALLHNNLVMAKNINRQYDSTFANSGVTMSGKIGPSLTIRFPNRYTVTTGAAMNLQDQTEKSTTMTVSTQKHVDISFTSADLTLTIDEFGDRYLQPAMAVLASTIDYDCLTKAAETVYNTAGVTTPASAPAHTFPWLQAGILMDIMACPRDQQRFAVVDPATQGAMVGALTGLYNPQSTIAEQYTNGSMGEALGFSWHMDQNVNQITAGTRNATTVQTSGVTASGATTIAVTKGSGVTFKAGDTFYFASGTKVHSVNPETKADTGYDQQFVITAAASTAGTSETLSISPTIITSGPYQTVTAVPDSGATMTFYVASTTGIQRNNICFHKDFMTLATADLVLPGGVEMAAREVFDGVSLRMVKQYEIINDRLLCRFDVLYGIKELYPQWACKVLGDATTLA